MTRIKKLILKIGAVFIGALLLLTFFSRTIYSINLPAVVLEYPSEGSIIRTANGQGIVDFTVKDAYYAEESGKVELLVTAGELVEAGRELFSITAEGTADADIIRLKLQRARSERDNLQNLDLAAAQKDMENSTMLYEEGIITKSQLDEQILSYQLKQQDVNKTLRDLQYEIEEYELQLKDITRGTTIVTAKRGGMVREIDNDIDSGAYVNQNVMIMRIGVAEEGYKALFSLPENVDYLQLGDAVTFNVRSRSLYGVNGEINRLIMENGRLMAQVIFMADGVFGGETAEINVHHTSDLHHNILPLTAIHSDILQDYVLFVERVEGTFGYEYYARRANINIDSQDNYNAAVDLSGSRRLPVIINSDKPVLAGDRVKVVGGSDLVEIR